MSGKKTPAHIMKQAEAKKAVEAIQKHTVKTKELAPHRDTSKHRNPTATKSVDEMAKASQIKARAAQQREAQMQARNTQMMEHEKAQQQQQQQGRGR